MIIQTILACLTLVTMFVFPFLPRRFMVYMLRYMWGPLWGLRGTAEGTEIYNKFKKTQANGIIVFSHPTFYDYIPVAHAINDIGSPVISASRVIGPIKHIVKRTNGFLVDRSKGGTAELLSERIMSRKPGDPILCISPTAGYNNDDQTIMTDFKTGAFITLSPVLPVVMYYHGALVWKDQSLFRMIYNRFSGGYVTYHAKVMEPLFAYKNETIEQFKERTRQYMELGVGECKRKVEYDIIHRYNEHDSFLHTLFNWGTGILCMYKLLSEPFLYVMLFTGYYVLYHSSSRYVYQTKIIDDIIWGFLFLWFLSVKFIC